MFIYTCEVQTANDLTFRYEVVDYDKEEALKRVKRYHNRCSTYPEYKAVSAKVKSSRLLVPHVIEN